jgi:hypothetical protein
VAVPPDRLAAGPARRAAALIALHRETEFEPLPPDPTEEPREQPVSPRRSLYPLTDETRRYVRREGRVGADSRRLRRSPTWACRREVSQWMALLPAVAPQLSTDLFSLRHGCLVAFQLVEVLL